MFSKKKLKSQCHILLHILTVMPLLAHLLCNYIVSTYQPCYFSYHQVKVVTCSVVTNLRMQVTDGAVNTGNCCGVE